MRITCPNCDAQYEVPEDVIPDEGRDVQCSSCGQTWLQHHPNHIPPEAAPEETLAQLQDSHPVEDAPAPDETYIETPPAAPQPQSRIDPEVADILRQEAERENAARVQDSAPIETQPDLGLTADVEEAADRRAREAKDRMARLRGEENDMQSSPAADQPSIGDAAAAAATLGARRDLLPDIEEINSTLRSASDRDIAGDDPNPDAPIRKRKKRGFRRGFILAVLLIAIAVLIYVFAPNIAEIVPQLDGLLGSYVAWVDGLRAALDTQVQTFLKWLDTQAAASGN